MKATHVLGKTIAAVIQQRYTLKQGAHVEHYALAGLVFTDGSVLRFRVNETETNPTVSGIYFGKDK